MTGAASVRESPPSRHYPVTSAHRGDVTRRQARGHEDSSDNVMVSVITVTVVSVLMCESQ